MCAFRRTSIDAPWLPKRRDRSVVGGQQRLRVQRIQRYVCADDVDRFFHRFQVPAHQGPDAVLVPDGRVVVDRVDDVLQEFAKGADAHSRLAFEVDTPDRVPAAVLVPDGVDRGAGRIFPAFPGGGVPGSREDPASKLESQLLERLQLLRHFRQPVLQLPAVAFLRPAPEVGLAEERLVADPKLDRIRLVLGNIVDLRPVADGVGFARELVDFLMKPARSRREAGERRLEAVVFAKQGFVVVLAEAADRVVDEVEDVDPGAEHGRGGQVGEAVDDENPVPLLLGEAELEVEFPAFAGELRGDPRSGDLARRGTGEAPDQDQEGRNDSHVFLL